MLFRVYESDGSMTMGDCLFRGILEVVTDDGPVTGVVLLNDPNRVN